MVVDAAMTVDTMEFIWSMVGVWMRRRSSAMAVSAELSSTTTESALSTSRFSVKMLLYGCTTTSPAASCLARRKKGRETR